MIRLYIRDLIKGIIITLAVWQVVEIIFLVVQKVAGV